jgi:hypothetical protein
VRDLVQQLARDRQDEPSFQKGSVP